jgi:hypothetical protein
MEPVSLVSKNEKASMSSCSPKSTPEAPRANELSTESSEPTQMPTGPESYDGVQDVHSVYPGRAIEIDRCSVEHLVETRDVSKVPVMPALEKVGQFP